MTPSDSSGPPSSPPGDSGDQPTFFSDRPLLPASLTARYDVIERLGAGGMGVVYKARDRETGAIVALKIIHPGIAGQPEVVERFKSELRLARQITHKNVCRVYDLNRFDDVVVISMEYVAGERLRDLVRRKQRLTVPEALGIVTQMIAALREAHGQGIVHRDIKPDNILIASDGTARLMDFGLARSADSAHTMTGAVLGTPAYMAPEQAEGRPVDRRTDIYALGLVLYEMLTGAAPFSGDTAITIALKQVKEAPVPPTQLEPTIPPAIESAVLRCLEKDPARRFQSVDELEQALARAVAGHGGAAVKARRAPMGLRGVVVLGAAALVVVVAAAVVVSMRHRPRSVNTPFRTFTLDNGLRVVVSEDHSAPTFSIVMAYNVGSRDEPRGKTGYAHLFEHLMFRGSDNVGPGEQALLVTNNGGAMNARTGPDTTVFYETMAANQLDLALFLEADRMRSLVIDAASFESQRSAVIQESQAVDNQPYAKTAVAIADTAYDNFALKHPILGAMEDLNAATPGDLAQFFKVYYAPNDAVLALVGDVKSDEALSKIKKYFGTIPAQRRPDRPDLTEPEQVAERRRVVQDPFTPNQRIDVVYKMAPPFSRDWYALFVAQGVLAGGQSSRLYEKLVKETEVAVNVAGMTPGLGGATLTGFAVLARPGKDSAQIEKLAFAEVDRLKHEPVTPEELGRVRMQFRRQLAQQSQSTLFRALALGQYEATYGRPELLNSTLPSLEQVTADDLQRAVRAYFSASQRSVILTVSGGPPPVRPAPQTIGDKTIAVGRVEQKGRAPVSNDVLRLELPVPVESVLDNGLTVVIVEDHRQPTVVAQLNVSGAGSLYDPPELPGLAGITAAMLRQGTKSRSSKQISADIENLGATLTVSSGFGSSATSLIASGLTDNFDAWFGLAADVLLHPVFPVDELNGFKQRLSSQFHQARATPSFLATERFNDAVFGSHPARVVATPPQVVATLTSDTLRKWFADVYDPENAVLAIVGDVDVNRVTRTIRENLGAWQKTGRKEVMPPGPVPVPATRVYLVDRPSSSQTTLLVGNIAIDRRDPDYIPAAVMIQIVGGVETGRLALNLRDQRGYAYSASMTLSALKYAGPWRISTDVQADATEDALRQILSEIRRIRDEPVPQSELDGGKRALAARFALSLEEPGQVLSYLAIQKIYGFSADYWDTYPAKIMEVSAQDVQRVAQRLLNPDAVVIVAVGDRQRIEPMLAKFGPVAVFDTNGRPVH